MRNKILHDIFSQNISVYLNNKHIAKYNLFSGFIFQLHVERKARFLASQRFWEGIYLKCLLFFCLFVFDNNNEITIPHFVITSLLCFLSYHIPRLENLTDVKDKKKFNTVSL